MFVPLRSVFQRLGASVVYEGGVINAHAPGREIALKVGSNLATINGVAAAVDTPPFIVGSTTYVPLRFISQALGAGVTYTDTGAVQTVAIDTLGPPPTPPPGAADLVAGARLAGSLSTDLNTATSNVGDRFAINIMPPYPNDDAAFAGSYISGHVESVTRASQGKKAGMELAFDKIVFADGHSLPLSARVVGVDQKHQSAIPQQAAGALGGMLLGNLLGKVIFQTGLGGVFGAAGGFLYANNLKTNFTVPKSSTVTVEVETPHRQSVATPLPVTPPVQPPGQPPGQ